MKTKRGPRSFFQIAFKVQFTHFEPKTWPEKWFVHRMMEGDVVSYCTVTRR